MVSDSQYVLADSEQAVGMTGMELLAAIKRGGTPTPLFDQHFPLQLHAFERGNAIMRIALDGACRTPAGLVHDGVLLVALDAAMRFAVMSTLERGKGLASIDHGSRIIRALHGAEAHEVEIIGTVVSTGLEAAVARGEVKTLDGELVATGTMACFIFSLRQ
jgi:acyl-coenzyme A thioesterase PaaI-like protein